jgi:hypothetical protein
MHSQQGQVKEGQVEDRSEAIQSLCLRRLREIDNAPNFNDTSLLMTEVSAVEVDFCFIFIFALRTGMGSMIPHELHWVDGA